MSFFSLPESLSHQLSKTVFSPPEIMDYMITILIFTFADLSKKVKESGDQDFDREYLNEYWVLESRKDM